jgi:molecular chaperone GrpE (heat shock protein)
MRIIRCIDNLELRISRKTAGSDDARSLEEVRDELLFALESSGVERYSPEPGSEYRGNERQLEAVRDREPNNEPDRSGQVAEIIRSGYKYVVSDNEEKIVRTAQVRLYE